jgi:hypothetical protein
MLDDPTYSASHGAAGIQMVVNLETNFRISLNQELKINLSNNWMFVIFYVDLIVSEQRERLLKGGKEREAKWLSQETAEQRQKKLQNMKERVIWFCILPLLKMETCSVKRVAGTCTELCIYICQLLLFVKISYFQCNVVLSTITKYVEIQRAITLIFL